MEPNRHPCPSPESSGGLIAGVDYGTVRIGVALADPRVRIATPHENYTRRSPEADGRYFRELVEEEGVSRFVVGLPVHLSGEESAKSHEARQFAAWLEAQTGVPVDLFDERFTTHEAEAALSQAGLTSKKRRARRDMLAAQALLAAYLEAHATRHQPPGPLDD